MRDAGEIVRALAAVARSPKSQDREGDGPTVPDTLLALTDEVID